MLRSVPPTSWQTAGTSKVELGSAGPALLWSDPAPNPASMFIPCRLDKEVSMCDYLAASLAVRKWDDYGFSFLNPSVPASCCTPITAHGVYGVYHTARYSTDG